jgi:hypothetical protein
MKESINPVTGNREITFQAKLVSISPDVVGSTPNNNKDYRVGTISFVNAKEERVQRTALVFEANFVKGMEIGNEYQTRAIIQEGQASPLLVMSHLTAGERASFEDFGTSVAEVTKNVEASKAKA